MNGKRQCKRVYTTEIRKREENILERRQLRKERRDNERGDTLIEIIAERRASDR